MFVWGGEKKEIFFCCICNFYHIFVILFVFVVFGVALEMIFLLNRSGKQPLHHLWRSLLTEPLLLGFFLVLYPRSHHTEVASTTGGRAARSASPFTPLSHPII